MIVLDTNVISESMRSRPDPSVLADHVPMLGVTGRAGIDITAGSVSVSVP
jgi:predicted nucleic acid-binding protein